MHFHKKRPEHTALAFLFFRIWYSDIFSRHDVYVPYAHGALVLLYSLLQLVLPASGKFQSAPGFLHSTRMSHHRLDELMVTDPDTIAVSCPFCVLMLEDAVKAKNLKVQVKDIGELLAKKN